MQQRRLGEEHAAKCVGEFEWQGIGGDAIKSA